VAFAITSSLGLQNVGKGFFEGQWGLAVEDLPVQVLHVFKLLLYAFEKGFIHEPSKRLFVGNLFAYPEFVGLLQKAIFEFDGKFIIHFE
jgi:hypothetical protein